MKKTLANDANRGDLPKSFGNGGTLATRAEVVEWDIVQSLDKFAVEVGPKFALDEYVNDIRTAKRADGTDETMLVLKNEPRIPNPLHVDKTDSLIINLNEFSGDVGPILTEDGVRVFAVCNYNWTRDELAAIKKLSFEDRAKVVLEDPDAKVKVPESACVAKLHYLLFVVRDPERKIHAAAAATSGGAAAKPTRGRRVPRV